MIILLAPEKLILSTTKEQWYPFKSKDIVLFTSYSVMNIDYLKNWQDIFRTIEFFENYPSNDTVELKLIEYIKQYDVENIIPMTEVDILRVCAAKEKFGIMGQAYNDAVLFRDKIAMKQHADKHNISVPYYKRIRNVIDLTDFIGQVDFPIIVKPILGRGSLKTLCLTNESELFQVLDQGLISNTSRYPDLLAEQYIDGDIYHVDGLQLNHNVEILNISKYVNNCLSFVNGAYLGSYTLAIDNPLRNKVTTFANQILDSFPLYRNSLFHIEVFVDRNQNIFLCEIACRLGGNGINDEVKLQQGVDIKLEYIKAECCIDTQFTKLYHDQKISGRLLIPPKEGKLISFPKSCDMPGVINYQIRGKEGKDYKKMQMSNDEIANFLLLGQSEDEMNENMMQLVNWFDKEVIWQI